MNTVEAKLATLMSRRRRNPFGGQWIHNRGAWSTSPGADNLGRLGADIARRDSKIRMISNGGEHNKYGGVTMSAAEMFCQPYMNAERVNRYRKAYPEDTRTDEEIMEYLNEERTFKRKVDKCITALKDRLSK